jgi:hypothetical protein
LTGSRLPFPNLHDSEVQANFEAIEDIVGDTGWIEPSALLNGWVQEGVPKVAYRRHGNEVRLKGQIKGGANGTTVFVLPPLFRPAEETQLTAVQTEAHGVAHIKITITGKVEVFYDGAASIFISIAPFTVD